MPWDIRSHELWSTTIKRANHGDTAVNMNNERAEWSRRYHKKLLDHLKKGRAQPSRAAAGLGFDGVALGLEPLDIARIHGQALTAALSTGKSSRERQRMIGLARRFFTEAIIPIEGTHRAAIEDNLRATRLTRTLRVRTMALLASERSLKQSIIMRQGSEQSLKKRGKRQTIVMARLHRLQKDLRNLAHSCLSKQEKARKQASVGLHDDVAQALIAVDLRLLALKKAASAGTLALRKEIVDTQRLVRESLGKLGRFTREFGVHNET